MREARRCAHVSVLWRLRWVLEEVHVAVVKVPEERRVVQEAVLRDRLRVAAELVAAENVVCAQGGGTGR